MAKTCRFCGRELPEENFNLKTVGGLQSYCKECYSHLTKMTVKYPALKELPFEMRKRLVLMDMREKEALTLEEVVRTLFGVEAVSWDVEVQSQLENSITRLEASETALKEWKEAYDGLEEMTKKQQDALQVAAEENSRLRAEVQMREDHIKRLEETVGKKPEVEDLCDMMRRRGFDVHLRYAPKE